MSSKWYLSLNASTKILCMNSHRRKAAAGAKSQEVNFRVMLRQEFAVSISQIYVYPLCQYLRSLFHPPPPLPIIVIFQRPQQTEKEEPYELSVDRSDRTGKELSASLQHLEKRFGLNSVCYTKHT
jgi:hypothetical protein